jgi:hypothetical protein
MEKLADTQMDIAKDTSLKPNTDTVSIEKTEEITIEKFFKAKYEEFYSSYNKIIEIFKISKKNKFKKQTNPNSDLKNEDTNQTNNDESHKIEILSNKENLKNVLNCLENLYFLVKENSNFFNFTKNVLSKLEKINFFDEILLFILKSIKNNSIKFTELPVELKENALKTLVFFIVIFMKFKIKSRVNVFEFFGLDQENKDLFKLIFEQITDYRVINLDVFEREVTISFFILCYQNLEIKYIAQNCLKYISFFLWVKLTKSTLRSLLLENDKYIEKWKILMKLNKKESILAQKPSFYFNDLIEDFLFLLENENNKFYNEQDPQNLFTLSDEENTKSNNKNYSKSKQNDQITREIKLKKSSSFIFYEKFIELIIDLITQISTRKFILPLLKEKHFIERIKITKFYLLNAENTLADLSEAEADAKMASRTEKEMQFQVNNYYSFKLFTKMIDNLKSFIDFEFDESSHENLNYEKRIMIHYEEINKLQAYAYELFPNKIQKFYLKCVSHIDNRENLEILLDNLTDREIIEFLYKLNLLNENIFKSNLDFYLKNKKLLKEIFVNKYERKTLLLDSLMETPLYPNEQLLFDNDLIPLDNKDQNELLENVLEIQKDNLTNILIDENKNNQLETYNNQINKNKTNNQENKDLAFSDEDFENLKSLNLLKYKNNNYFVEKPYPVPKLNLQFLTNFDYLLRNFTLFKFESTYEIKQDIQDVIERIHPVFDSKGILRDFDGWSRMAIPIKIFKILVSKKPKIGKKYSEEIIADIEYSLNGIQPHIRSEWDKLKKHDILFLITFQLKKPLDSDSQQKDETNNNNNNNVNSNDNKQKKQKSKFNLDIVKHVRGCEVRFLYDTDNNEFSEIENIHSKKPVGLNRRVQVTLDGIQYNQDLASSENNIEEIYSSFHLLVRRKPKENNFRAILETIRDLMNETTVIPPWLENIFLGYGDPTTADYRKLNDFSQSQVDFYDTFLNEEHFKDAFLNNENIPSALRAQINKPEITPKFLKLNIESNPNHVYEILKKIDRLETIKLLNNKNAHEQIRKNKIKFTQKQTEAIVSGLHHGLTTVVGPPGTGKTDVAVQIVSLIYHNFPNQRTIVVTHSNNALNDIFEKISKLDINERYLLRLGIGEKELSVTLDKDFSRYGRINFMLERRIDLLSNVLKLAESINVYTHEEYTCENAILFYEFHIKSRIKEFKNKLQLKFKFDFDKEILEDESFKGVFNDRKENDNIKNVEDEKQQEMLKLLQAEFPFAKFFKENLFKEMNLDSYNSNVNGDENKNSNEIFISDNFRNEIKKANTLMEYIEALFTEVSEVRAFELLRNNVERGNYLLTKQAKVVAMTCTHAALKRREFIKLGFEYDNIIVEEAAQILEVETFIPLLLQNCDRYKQSRLKRVILIGDDNQLPPIVKHSTYKNYSKLDQSLFNRFVRTGIPYIKLDSQGRTRYLYFN